MYFWQKFLVICISVLICYPGVIQSSGIVTLDSLEIYNTHEWFKASPTVYFHCKAENNGTELPDIKKPHVVYTFNGQESWQPLTEFTGTKCKRCGLYEKDTVNSDDVFDEWEFCPSDFDADGRYVKFKEKEFNATFICANCVRTSDSNSRLAPQHEKGKGMHIFLVILISAAVSVLLIFAVLVGYKYWQKRKREQDQARFLKLFDDGDDIEDELELGM
ncbi:hypothetical protein ACFE04_020326 [Oxalis oulophora]